jgi:pantoate--beta-alanine ligase
MDGEQYAIDIINATAAMQARAEALRTQGKRIALVPTMGFLHEGHLSLMRLGLEHADTLVVSIFVNPTQFGPGEDLETYPRDMARDLDLCRQEKARIIFAPEPQEIYPPRFQTYVNLDALPHHLCGLSRPVFFQGVCTVVAKLFNIVRPHVAVFGEKDFQQLTIIRHMVRDLNFPIEIVGAPTIRESDGLAMSSRNAYLTAEQRPAALSLNRALHLAAGMVANGETDAGAVIDSAARRINSNHDAAIDYVAICNPLTLENMETIDGPARMFLAVKVGKARLIDNMALTPKAGPSQAVEIHE